MCVIIKDPAMGLLKIEEVSTLLSVNKKDNTDKVFEEMYAQVSTLVCKAWLSCYPQPRCIGSKFKLPFAMLCDKFGIECKATTMKNPQ